MTNGAKRVWKRLLTVLFLAMAAAGIAFVFRPKPITVETTVVRRGSMQVTVDEDGETRAHDRFTLAAPVAGFLSRITLHEGDRVGPKTVIATVRPLPIDSREEAEIRARIASAEAIQREAEQQAARLEASHAQAKRDLARARMLVKDDVIPRQQFEEAQSKEEVLAREVEAAKHRIESTAADVKRAEAGLLSVQTANARKNAVTEIRAPMDSRVLRILEKSERVVTAGTPVVTLSNPNRLEAVVDLLSTDSVKVEPGAPVVIENWGGDKPLRGRVRNIEPFGFTKVSALGIEEQRVNVVVDFVDSPGKLGDGYRVDARIVIWEGQNVLKVPTSALFRAGEQWRAFLVDGDRVRSVEVKAGHRSALETEVLEGLQGGAEVVLHPPNELKEGSRVMIRRR